MPKKPRQFYTIRFSWPVLSADRLKIEDYLRTLGYDVDGGGSDLVEECAYIHIRPKARSHKRRAPASPPQPPGA